MPQSLARILVHTVFSTKDRRPSLRDTALRKALHHYLGGILKCGIDCREGGQTIQPFQGKMGDAKGVIHTSPGQRPGLISPKPHQR